MAEFVGAVDQGTTSTRFMIFDHGGNEVGRHQLEHEQILPQAGWVEHNPRRDLGAHVGGAADRAQQDEPERVGPRRAGHHQPARDRRRVGPAHRRPSTTRSSGRTRAPTASPPRWNARARATSSGGRPGSRPPPTSPAARSSGSWRTSTGRARRPSGATRSSATPTPGCCGTSRAGYGAACTSPTSPTPAAPC